MVVIDVRRAGRTICFIDEAEATGVLAELPQQNDQPAFFIGGPFLDSAALRRDLPVLKHRCVPKPPLLA